MSGDVVDLRCGEARAVLADLPEQSVHCCITSPPYWNLRDYQSSEQIGHEKTLDAYVRILVEVFGHVKRVLRDDGTLWLVLGDGFGPDKQLLGAPWKVAFALQDAGWIVRSEIIWAKCLSGGVTVYARCHKGDMPMTVKDLVRLDPAAVQLWNGERWTQAVAWTRSADDGDPLEVELRSGERIGCTPSHQWPTLRGLVRAADLRIGDVIQTCRLPEPEEPHTPAHLPNDVGWFVGLYLAEGSRGKDGACIQVAGHVKETERFARLQAIAADYGGTCALHHTGGNAVTINLYGDVLRAILALYVSGSGAKDKRLSNACWRRSNTFLRALLDGYLEGDGARDIPNDRWRLGFADNYGLAADMRTLCARLGAGLRLKQCTGRYNGQAYPMWRGELRWGRSGHHNAKHDAEVVRIGLSKGRQFWDVAVADEPHVFALASGVLTHNSNPMPESVRDRCTRAHETVFMLAKGPRYYYDADAIREPLSAHTWYGTRRKAAARSATGNGHSGLFALGHTDSPSPQGRNKRTVWTLATAPFSAHRLGVDTEHFAAFPPELVRPMVRAGCPPDGTVVDPFCGSGTTGFVAVQEGRRFLGCDINADYVRLAQARIATAQPARPLARLAEGLAI